MSSAAVNESMIDQPKRKPVLWPMIFLGAFGLGALLWVSWMVWILHDRQKIKRAEYYPLVVAPAAGSSNATANSNSGTNGH